MPKEKEKQSDNQKDCYPGAKDKKPGKHGNRKGYQRGKHGFKDKGKDEGNTNPKDHKTNDPKFYTKYASLAASAARLAFNHRNGAELEFITPNATTKRFCHDPIMVFMYMMTPGISNDKMSGINVAAEATYKVLNRKYRGSLSSRYQIPDLGIIMFAVTDFFVNLSSAERVYGICQKALVNQKQLPRQLALAMGYDFDDIATNLADFRLQLNNLIIRAQALCLLKGTSLLDHHLFLTSNVFKDKDTARAQYLCFVKPNYWLWDPESLTTGSMVRCIQNLSSKTIKNTGSGAPLFSALRSASDIIHDLDVQLTALLDDSDIDAVCSDILAYYGNDNPEIVRLSLLPEDYSVEAIFNEDLLRQVHNSTVSDLFKSNSNLADDMRSMITPVPVDIIGSGVADADIARPMIYQKDGTIKFNLQTGGSAAPHFIKPASGVTKLGSTGSIYYPINTILDTDSNDPTTDQIIEYTRNQFLSSGSSFDDSGTTCYSQDIVTCGSTFIYKCVMFTFRDPKLATEVVGGLDYAGGLVTNYLVTAAGAPSAAWTKFDWAPVSFNNNGEFYGDLDNYITIDTKQLMPIHNVALLSEFHNPVADLLIADK